MLCSPQAEVAQLKAELAKEAADEGPRYAFTRSLLSQPLADRALCGLQGAERLRQVRSSLVLNPDRASRQRHRQRQQHRDRPARARARP